MQQHIVPTSPKSTERPVREDGFRSARYTFILVCIGTLFGIVGGVVGSIYTQNIITSIEGVGNSPLFQFTHSDVHDLSSMDSVRDSIASVLSDDSRVLDYAVTVSADGWFAVPDEYVNPEQVLTVQLYSGIKLSVQRTVMRTDLGLVFLKTNRVDLRPVTFYSSVPKVAQPAIAFAATHGSTLFSVGAIDEMRSPALLASSVQFARRFVMHDARIGNVPLFTEDRAFLGFLRESGEVIPAVWVNSGFVRIDDTGHAAVEIQYTSVRNLSNEERTLKQYPDQGWVVATSVLGFKKDDVIVRIDNVAVDDSIDLATIIAGRIPGAQMAFEVIRNGATQVVTILAY